MSKALLIPIVPRLVKLIRLLSSDLDGEVVAATRALVRELLDAGADVHAFADLVGEPNDGAPTEAETKRIIRCRLQRWGERGGEPATRLCRFFERRRPAGLA